MYTWERRSGRSWNTVTNRSSYTTNSNMAVGQYTYRCVVRNEAGSVMSNSATVNVYGEYCAITLTSFILVSHMCNWIYERMIFYRFVFICVSK